MKCECCGQEVKKVFKNGFILIDKGVEKSIQKATEIAELLGYKFIDGYSDRNQAEIIKLYDDGVYCYARAVSLVNSYEMIGNCSSLSKDLHYKKYCDEFTKSLQYKNLPPN